MKILNYSFSMLLAVAIVALNASCRDESLNPVPAWDTAVSGNGILVSTNNSFSLTDVTKPVQYKFRWLSIDNLNTVTKIEYYVALNETYIDKEGNSRTAKHGDKLWKVVEGSAVPANRVFIDQSLTQAEVYALYKDNTFNYGNGTVSVFAQNGRTAAKPFISADKVVIRWELTTADGRKFFQWSPGVCGESIDAAGVPFTNCNLTLSIK